MKKKKEKKTRETIERRSRFSECRRHECGGGGGRGYERWMAPLVRGVWGGPKKIV